MNLLSVENIAKSYGVRVLFEKVSFGIEQGEKVGIIGVNGTGKSTLLKIIAGVETADTGKVIRVGGLEVEYLPQNPQFDPCVSVLEQVFKGDSASMRVLRAYEQALAQAHYHPANSQHQAELIRASQAMDAHNIWQLESEAKAILTKLGIVDFSAAMGTLSGGQQKRVAMASALIHPADLLILDEPTNHIDNDTVAWLEQYLQKRKGALLMITHDRYFLDRVTNRMLELDDSKLYSYSGNYSQFLESKAEREQQQASSDRKRENLLRKELAWIRRGAKARTTKQKARIDRFEKLSDEEVKRTDSKLELSVGASRLGKTVIEIEHISKRFEDTTVIADFSYIVLKRDRVGIIGPNGSGKSTLLNLLTGKIAPDSGTVTVGQTVKIGYFSQQSDEMNQELRVIEYIQEEAHYIATADGGEISATRMLERFLFPPSLQWMPIAKLSGGEKRRLYLLRVLMGAPNVLLLDEPTNDLDIQTLTILEDYLDDFPGAVIAVSHDRYFLDRLVDKVFAFEGDGKLEQYLGGYTDYQENLPQPQNEIVKGAEGKKQVSVDKTKERQRKFTFNEQREYEQIDGKIAEAEQQLQAINAEIDGASSDFQRLQELVSVQKELERTLDTLLERWVYLNELASRG